MGDDALLDVVIAGGGQAGLALGRQLGERGMTFESLDENERIGASWRGRRPSLTLFTPGRYAGLPGMSFPGDPDGYPSKDAVAAYLCDYADLRCRCGWVRA